MEDPAGIVPLSTVYQVIESNSGILHAQLISQNHLHDEFKKQLAHAVIPLVGHVQYGRVPHQLSKT